MLKIATRTVQLCVDITRSIFRIFLTGLWASIGVTYSYSCRLFLCALGGPPCQIVTLYVSMCYLNIIPVSAIVPLC